MEQVETRAALRVKMCDWSTHEIRRAMALVEQELVDGYEDAQYAVDLIEMALETLEGRAMVQQMVREDPDYDED